MTGRPAETDAVEAAWRVLAEHGVLVCMPKDKVLDAIEAALDAADAADELAGRCDEPGCDRQATGGFPVRDERRYRFTCHEHGLGEPMRIGGESK